MKNIVALFSCVVSLSVGAFECSDAVKAKTMRKGVYEYRVLAVSGDDEAYSVSSRCEFTPKRGLTIKIN